MRYGAWFAGKLTAAAIIFRVLLVPISQAFPPENDELAPLNKGARFLLCDLALMVWFLLLVGALYLIVWDQRYRCRVCLRRLRMPIETGSWGRMLFLGRPRIEYICPYGHGTLKEEELQISGIESPEWTESGDMWAELCATSKDSE